ncbi:MAG: bifunctional 5,10-methylenetetrahydrofolate dehydrogenase/5,10-methenyltetrahydrofolate cyclohydrolase [Betaproteobacteria bacterium]|nr:bifunctional 5,10-methylenetetrahydrofolate dehydrogenase/5,10-methenyltetrahydrofolate cyclohydrolase [Betaproteobacteria bacterium]
MRLFQALRHDGFDFKTAQLNPSQFHAGSTAQQGSQSHACLSLDGRIAAQWIRHHCAEKVKEWGAAHLAVILASSDPASRVYVNHKIKAFKEAGMHSTLYEISEDMVSEAGLVELICQLNDDSSVHGILVQLPLAQGISQTRIIESIRPDKDVDGFANHNVGLLHQGRLEKALLPCTPAGVIALLGLYGVTLAGKHAVVVGRSAIVGRPMSGLLLHEDATVTVAHSKTQNLDQVCREADVLIVAAGRRGIVSRSAVKPGAVVVDVGMHRLPDGKLCGDVDPDVFEVAGLLTPVPGGVGPMTIAMLLLNTLRAAHLRQHGR